MFSAIGVPSPLGFGHGLATVRGIEHRLCSVLSSSLTSAKMTATATIFLMLFALSATQRSSTKGDDTFRIIERAFKTCRERHNIDMSYIEGAVRNRMLPRDDKGRGFIRCIIARVGFNELKNIIRGGKLPKGNVAGLFQIPDIETKLEEIEFMGSTLL